VIKLTMLTPDDKIAEIKRLYFTTTRDTIADDFAKALDLLKSLASEGERERAAVFMDGLAEMRSDWGQAGGKKKGGGQRAEGKGQREKGKGQRAKGRK
jgi:hypothetical protein